jgi:hypothetical protein
MARSVCHGTPPPSIALAAWQVETDEFVELITDKSQGNFMYLVHILSDIHAGGLSAGAIDNINDLPRGLREYYNGIGA